MTLLLGIDAGSTMTKSVLFTADGRQLGSAARRVPLSHPRPGHVERDPDEVWAAVLDTVRRVLDETGTAPDSVTAIGVTAHGDGLYLVDADGRPTRPGITSLDTRATTIVDEWVGSGISEVALQATGQHPMACAPAALLAWLVRHEPEVVARSRWAMACKDVVKLRLTGCASTEPTEASVSFADVRTQRYDPEVLALYGLEEVDRLLPPILGCAEVAGTLSAEAAGALGLRPGTPVAGSAHDVDASAIGSGVHFEGVLSVVAGTYSINQVIHDAPVVDPAWCARSFVEPGTWMHMAISPTSSANLEWFARTLCADELERGYARGDEFGFVEREIAAVAGDPSDVVYLPFLFGSPSTTGASATFTGVRGWHSRGHLLRAVCEGVTFAHRAHVDELDRLLPTRTARLTGGASRSARWRQLFADVLGRPVEVPEASETGALGVCLLAGVATGVWPHLDSAVADTVRTRHVCAPRDADRDRAEHAYQRWLRTRDTLARHWAGT